jgi:hypothetical protein
VFRIQTLFELYFRLLLLLEAELRRDSDHHVVRMALLIDIRSITVQLLHFPKLVRPGKF